MGGRSRGRRIIHTEAQGRRQLHRGSFGGRLGASREARPRDVLALERWKPGSIRDPAGPVPGSAARRAGLSCAAVEPRQHCLVCHGLVVHDLGGCDKHYGKFVLRCDAGSVANVLTAEPCCLRAVWTNNNLTAGRYEFLVQLRKRHLRGSPFDFESLTIVRDPCTFNVEK